MCRIAAYEGPEIPLADVISAPSHSLLAQSQHAQEAKLAVNADGFGLAWYGKDPAPGLYRDVFPAWSDSNLTEICRTVASSLFLAHVRAATTGETSRANCHPFRHGTWSFMHNGKIGDYGRLRRQLESLLPDALFAERAGSTDSEIIFLLALHMGLKTAPQTAICELLRLLNRLNVSNSPDRITCAFSDGQRLYAFRYASDARAPTLYAKTVAGGGTTLASEPLDADPTKWNRLPQNTLMVFEAGKRRDWPLTDNTVQRG